MVTEGDMDVGVKGRGKRTIAEPDKEVRNGIGAADGIRMGAHVRERSVLVNHADIQEELTITRNKKKLGKFKGRSLVEKMRKGT